MKHASVWAWEGLPSSIRNRLANRTPFFAGLQEPKNHTGNITVTGREQGLKDTDRRDSIKRGGV